VGGELVSVEALKSGRVEIIVENARKFLEAVRSARKRLSGVAGNTGTR